MSDIYLSVVVPSYNEEKNIPLLYRALKLSLDKLGNPYEIIYVDDGSEDKSVNALKELKKNDPCLKLVIFRRNYGQTAAIDAGIKASVGRIIVTMDGDLQNDPSDIVNLISMLEEGYDCVSGWRYPRRDTLMRNFLSLLADKLRRCILKDSIHDSGCTLKIFRRECFNNLSLYGDMHRFIPAILHWRGFKIGEIKVKHFPRKSGKSKYGIGRVFRGLIDLIVLRFWSEFSSRPAHLFGILGLFLFGSGFLAGLYVIFLKFIQGIPVSGRPMLFLSLLLLVMGSQFIVFGLLSDIMIQIYYGSSGRQTYHIKEIIR